jgi:hypothetical protein
LRIKSFLETPISFDLPLSDGSSRGRRGELAVFDTAGADQLVGDSLDLIGPTFDGDDLKAIVVVEVDMHARQNRVVRVVLDLGEAVGEITLVVVVNEGDRADDLLVIFPFVPNQSVTDQVAKRLGAVLIAVPLGHSPEALKEIRIDGNAKTSQVAHGTLPKANDYRARQLLNTRPDFCRRVTTLACVSGLQEGQASVERT